MCIVEEGIFKGGTEFFFSRSHVPHAEEIWALSQDPIFPLNFSLRLH